MKRLVIYSEGWKDQMLYWTTKGSNLFWLVQAKGILYNYNLTNEMTCKIGLHGFHQIK